MTLFSASPFQPIATPSRATRDVLSRQVTDLARLHELATHLVQDHSLQPVLEEVLQAVIDLLGADCGVLMLHDPEEDCLFPVASVGLSQEYLARVKHVSPGEGGSGSALRERRTIIVEDVWTDPHFAQFLDVAALGGYRAALATPLVAPDGKVLGTIAAYFVTTHRPSDWEVQLVELYARYASGAVERMQLLEAAENEIAERKRAEALNHYIMGTARCLLWYADVYETGGKYFHWDAHFPELEIAERFLPLRRRQGESFQDAYYRCRLPEDRDECDRLCATFIRAGKSYSQDFRCRCARGAIRWLHEDVRVETVVPHRHWRIVAVCTDVTERRRAEEAVRSSNAEITSLNGRLQRAMMETHHRVKNNLQVIAALLEMVVDQHEHAVPVDEVKSLTRNVQALAAIHDLLTQETKRGSDVQLVSGLAVLSRLLPSLRNTVATGRIHVSLDDPRLEGRQATALALIVNELVGNAAKHGAGEIFLGLTESDGTVRLEVADEGPGFPEGFDAERSAHTGLELVVNLGRCDLAGAVSFENRPECGARVVLLFPLSGVN